MVHAHKRKNWISRLSCSLACFDLVSSSNLCLHVLRVASSQTTRHNNDGIPESDEGTASVNNSSGAGLTEDLKSTTRYALRNSSRRPTKSIGHYCIINRTQLSSYLQERVQKRNPFKYLSRPLCAGGLSSQPRSCGCGCVCVCLHQTAFF